MNNDNVNNEQVPASASASPPVDPLSSKPSLRTSYVKVDTTPNAGLREGAINLLKSIHGRDPTADEITRIETRLAQRLQKPT